MSTEHDGNQDLANVIVQYRNGVPVLTLIGEHDMATAASLEALIDTHGTHAGLVVGLDQVDFIDSYVIRALYTAHHELARGGKRLVIQDGANSTVRRVLQVTGIRDQVSCADTIDEAVNLTQETQA